MAPATTDQPNKPKVGEYVRTSYKGRIVKCEVLAHTADGIWVRPTFSRNYIQMHRGDKPGRGVTSYHKIEPVKQQCGSCIFCHSKVVEQISYLTTGKRIDCLNVVGYTCRAHPPSSESGFPSVSQSDWCGEWKEGGDD